MGLAPPKTLELQLTLNQPKITPKSPQKCLRCVPLTPNSPQKWFHYLQKPLSLSCSQKTPNLPQKWLRCVLGQVCRKDTDPQLSLTPKQPKITPKESQNCPKMGQRPSDVPRSPRCSQVPPGVPRCTDLSVEVEEALGAVDVVEGREGLHGAVDAHGVQPQRPPARQQHPVRGGAADKHLGQVRDR